MQKYFFTLNECGKVLIDEEGVSLSGIEEARERATVQARSIMRAEVEEGRLCMSCQIDVLDDSGALVLSLPFKEAVKLSGI